MIQAITLFPKSTDPEVVDAFLDQLVASLKQSPGFQSIKVSEGYLMSPGGPPPFSKVIEFSFDSLENMMAWANQNAAQSQKTELVEQQAIMLYFESKEL